MLKEDTCLGTEEQLGAQQQNLTLIAETFSAAYGNIYLNSINEKLTTMPKTI
jgi:hypothetical protein